jgi:serine/threonine protein kinase
MVMNNPNHIGKPHHRTRHTTLPPGGNWPMERYKVVKPLGDGTYGSVLKAVNKQTGEIVSVFSRCVAERTVAPQARTALRRWRSRR